MTLFTESRFVPETVKLDQPDTSTYLTATRVQCVELRSFTESSLVLLKKIIT